MKIAIRIKEQDQVATLTEDLNPGEHAVVTGTTQTLQIKAEEFIPSGHKIALMPIRKNESIYKYGEVIGIATCEILPGTRVHVHNCWGMKARRRNAKPVQEGEGVDEI